MTTALLHLKFVLKNKWASCCKRVPLSLKSTIKRTYAEEICRWITFTMIICWMKKVYKMWKCLQCGLWLLFIPYLFLLQCLIYILHWLWIVLKIVFCPWYRLHFDNFFHSFVFALLCYFSLKKFFVILWVYHIGIVWPAGKIKQIFSLRYPTFF